MTISDKLIFLLCPANNDIWFCHLQFTLPAWSQIIKHAFSHFLSLVTHSTSWLILLFSAPIHLLLFCNYHSIYSTQELLLLKSPGPPLLFKHLFYLFLLAASLAVVFSHSRAHDLSSCLPLCWMWSGTHSGTSHSSWPNFTANYLPLLSFWLSVPLASQLFCPLLIAPCCSFSAYGSFPPVNRNFLYKHPLGFACSLKQWLLLNSYFSFFFLVIIFICF